MSLESLFRSAVEELRGRQVVFAVAGGFAAALYRDEPRLTMDVDVGIGTDAVETAVAVLEALGLQAGIVREADLAGGPTFAIHRKNTAPCLVVGRPADDPHAPGVDILLPAIPWTTDAIRRAQANLVDFGFGRVPTLTLEDVVISKLYALRAIPLRAKDLDDLQSIFRAGRELDMPYLVAQVKRFGIVVPGNARTFLPAWLVKSVGVGSPPRGRRRT